MKKIILLLVSCLLVLPLFAQFKANMVFNTMGKDGVFKVYSSEQGYRYEFNEDGQQGVIIVKANSPEVIILMPQQKMAMKSSANSPMNMASDPIGSYKNFQKEGTLKEVGKEEVNGLECTKSELWKLSDDESGQATQKMFTIWTSDKYNFPIKMINHIDGQEGSGMELKDIEPWNPDATSYSIPEGYQIMDMGAMMPK